MNNTVLSSRPDRLYQATVFSWVRAIFAMQELYFFPSLEERRYDTRKHFYFTYGKSFSGGF